MKIKTTCVMSLLTAFGSACSGSDEMGELGENHLHLEVRGKDSAPEELTIKGRRFIRHDLVSTEQWLAMRDPASLGEPDTVEKLAIQLMAHTENEFGYYVQAEPDLALAERILNPDLREAPLTRFQVPPPGEPLVEKAVIGSDNRTGSTCHGCMPSSWVGFMERGDGGTLVGWSTIYTVAHGLFDNQSPGIGWTCRDGTIDTTTAPPNTNPCDGPGEPGDPRWKFQPDGIITCGQARTVSNVWINGAPSNWWTFAQEDYGVVELNCSANRGHMGSTIYQAGNLEIHFALGAGYPQMAPCPAGSNGSVLTGDCPNGLFQYGPNFTQPPYSSMVLHWTPLSTFYPGTEKPTRTWREFADTTVGDSGGPLVRAVDGSYYIIGVHSNSTPGASPVNRANRLDSNVWNFIVANSSL